MSYREWCNTTETRFDDTDTADVVTDIEGEMADISFVLYCVYSYIVCVMS